MKNYKRILIFGIALLLLASLFLTSTPLTSIPRVQAAGGLATGAIVQLDANNPCAAEPCTDLTLESTFATGTTFRAGAVVAATGPTPGAVGIGQALTADNHCGVSSCFKFIGSLATWIAGSVVVFDTNNNGLYDAGEPVVAGPTPVVGTALRTDPLIKYVDSNANGVWDFGETVVRDSNGDNTYTAGEPLIGPSVFGWEFSINYDSTVLAPQADPNGVAAYPDGGGSTLLLGAIGSNCPVYGGAGLGGCNWNAAGSGGSTVFQIPTPGKALVGFTYLAPHGATFINANVLLGNIAFELVKGGTAAAPLTTTLTLGDIKFVDVNAVTIPQYGTGGPSTITINNTPPTAAFTATHLPTGDPSCTPITGLACSAFAFRFDGTASSDPDGDFSTATATAFNWDFGDSLTDLGVQGSVAIHDYGGALGPVDATLRVIDTTGATGSAHDGSGAVLVNAQPSHIDHMVDVTPPANPTSTTVSCVPSSVAFGASTTCTSSVTDTSTTPITPTGTVTFTSSGTGTFTGSPCTLAGTAASATCSATFAPTGTTARTDTITATYPGDTGHATSSGIFSLSVTTSTHSTTTTVACLPTTAAIGQATSCTATVTDTSTAGATTPTGMVIFASNGAGTFVTSPCTLAGATSSATCSVTYTPSGTVSGTRSDTITATYSGDTTHSAGTPGTTSLTVTLRTTTTQVLCTPSTIDTTMTSSCTATVTDFQAPTGTMPTGTLTLSTTGATGTFSPCTLAAGSTLGLATCTSTFTPTSTGTASIVGVYSGDTGHSTSTSPATTVIVNAAAHATTTTVSCTPSTVVINQPTNCTATVTDTATTGATPPTGPVSFTPGALSCALGTLTTTSASCSVNITPAPGSPTGAITVRGIYVPDITHAASQGTFSLTVNKRATTISVSCTPSTIDVGQTTSCTITVTDTDVGTAITPSGNAFLTPTAICTLAGTGATATCSNTESSTSTPGILQVTATYGGDSAHAGPPPSAPFPVTVNGRTTTTGVACPASGTVGTPFTCTVTVTDIVTGTSSTPTGTVTVNTVACSTLTGTGTTAICTVSITPSASGSLTVTANYAGDTTHIASTGSTTVSISPAAAHPTTTTVTCTPMTLDLGQTTSCTATVTDTSSTPTTPTGALTFLPSAFTCTLQGTATVGVATCSFGVTPPTLGSFTVTPTYPGDSTHATSTGSTSVTVNLRTTSTTVSCPASGTVGTAFSCTVTVTDTDTGTSSTPTGTFTVNGATCTLAGTGTSATCNINITPTATGPLTVTATYPGDTTHATSTGSATANISQPAAHPTATTVSCSPNPLRAGVISTCTTTVTDTSTSGATAPTGQITLGIGVPAGGTVTALCTLSGTGATASCTVPVTLLVAFTSNIQASYPGDTTHSSSSGSTSLTATARPTTTSILCLPASVDTGSATTCTAVVSDTIITPAITPAGTVGFTTSGTGTFATSPCTLQPGPGTTTASCFVTYTPTGTTARTDTITASYVPDAAHAASTHTALVMVTITVVAHPTTTAIVCDQTVVAGQPSLCSATVTDTSTIGATSPLDTVTWSLGPATQGTGAFDSSTCSLVAGAAGMSTCSVHFTSQGPGGDIFQIQASYGGSVTHSTSSGSVSFAIPGRSTTATITCTTPVTVGTASTCNITITDTSPVPAVTPTGSFPLTTSGSGFFGPNCLLAGSGGVATCTVNYTPSTPGMHTITAVLPIGGAFSYNTAGTFDITANASALNPTSTVLHCAASTILFTSVLCTVLVTDTATIGATAPLGTVTSTFTPFNPIVSCDLIAGTGPVSSCIPPIAGITTIGTITITASYLGDSSHAPSQGQTTFIVTGDPTMVNILCSPNPVNTGTPTTCTAYVQVKIGITGETAPTGTVEFSVEFATGTTGTFTNSPCTLVPPTSDPFSPSTCSVQYTSTATISRIDYVHANYVPDDATHESSGGSGSVAITALNPTTTTISCTPSPVVIGSTSTCTATVIDVAGSPTVPTGTVSFITDSTTGGFAGSTCNLVGRDSTSATCSVTYSPGGTTARTDRITGTYSGDAQHLTSPGAFNLDVTVGPHPTSVAVSCIPGNPGTTVPIGTTVLCHLIINDFSTGATPPTGTVALVSSGTGTIAGSPCSLTALFPGSPATSTCQPDYIGYTPNGTVGTAGRTDTLTFTYSGDAVHSGSSGTFQLSITQNVVPPTVSFTEDKTTAFRGQMITLTITTVAGTGTINTVRVDWGDTTIDTLLGTATTDSHAYSSLGSFKVTVTVTDSNSLTTSGTATKTIINQLPTVSFTEDKTTAPTGTQITLTIKAADSDGTVASIAVVWGDNTPIDNLGGTATTDTHTYTKSGSYIVTVTATDNDGGIASSTATKTITDRAPTASFTFTPANPLVGQTVTFDATASTDPDGTILTYAWNFGDTTTGTGATTTHAYTAGGSYTVTLTVTDDAGLTGTTSATVQVTQQVTNPGHAKLIQWKADAKFNPDNLRRNPTQVLRAYGLNNGTVTVNVYVQFSITNPDGTTNTIYTKVVSLTPGRSINGRLDNRFTASFTTLPGRTNVTATIFYSSTSSKIGDASFTPDNASAKTFSFNALGVRTDDFNFQEDITSTSQYFDVSVQNAANIDLISRIDITIRQPDGATTNYVSDGLLLQSGQNGEIKFIVPLTGPDGTYCFTATVKYGIDTNHNGQLDNNEILGTSGRQHDCFSADTDDASAGSIIAPPMTITHVSTDDCDD